MHGRGLESRWRGTHTQIMGLLLTITAIALGFAEIDRIKAILGIVIVAAIGLAYVSLMGNLTTDTIAKGAIGFLGVVSLFFWLGRGIRSLKRRRA